MSTEPGQQPSPGNRSENVFPDALEQDYEREDERWSGRNQFYDWLLLIAIGVIDLTWMLIVFWLEPGIR
ncbi:MAG: hypothetical protein M1455_11625 [Actinobacteria bacterium]|nr:hypothetical protein [Actinomycetota bacterium]